MKKILKIGAFVLICFVLISFLMDVWKVLRNDTSGIVYDTTTGRPVADAEIQIGSSMSILDSITRETDIAQTDKGGKFSIIFYFHHVDRITVFHEKYLPFSSQQTRNITVNLTPINQPNLPTSSTEKAVELYTEWLYKKRETTAICQNFSDKKAAEICIQKIAFITRDSKVCKLISDSTDCLYYHARDKQDISFCDEATRPSVCREKFNAFTAKELERYSK